MFVVNCEAVICRIQSFMLETVYDHVSCLVDDVLRTFLQYQTHVAVIAQNKIEGYYCTAC